MNIFKKMWCVLGAANALSLTSLAMVGVRMDVGLSAVPAALMLILVPVALMRRNQFQAPTNRLALDVIHAVTLFAAISWTGALASYAVAARSHGWYDDMVMSWDGALHFHWIDLYRIYPRSFIVVAIGRAAYASIAFTPAVLVAALVIERRCGVLERFLLAYILALGATVAIFAFLPMQSAIAHVLHGNTNYYRPLASQVHVQIIDGLRSGWLTRIDPITMIGLITFPSFHAACGVLFSWAGWHVRVYRIPMLMINLAMIASTPIEGTHYLSDIIGGIILAGVAIFATRALRPIPHREIAPERARAVVTA